MALGLGEGGGFGGELAGLETAGGVEGEFKVAEQQGEMIELGRECGRGEGLEAGGEEFGLAGDGIGG